MSGKILVIDADAIHCRWEQLHLATMGYEVETVTDLHDLRTNLRGSQRPDVLILALYWNQPTHIDHIEDILAYVRETSLRALLVVDRPEWQGHPAVRAFDPNWVFERPLTGARWRDIVTRRFEEAADLRRQDPREHFTSAATDARHQERTSGSLVESKVASVLVVSVRNIVTLARSLRGRTMESLLQRFLQEVRDAVSEQGGWIVRVDASGLHAVFEDAPGSDRPHANRAVEAGLRSILCGRRARQWAEAHYSDAQVPHLSVGCGVASGEVLICRMDVGGPGTPSLAGTCPDVAYRLDGRAKGLGWSFAVSDSTLLLAGARFQFGRRATLETADHATVMIAEVTGFNPGAARPGELRMMAEVREAVLANAILARIPSDADARTSDLTVLSNAPARLNANAYPTIPDRHIVRRMAGGPWVNAYRSTHQRSGRSELIKTIDSKECPPECFLRYMAAYRELSSLEQRNIVEILEVGQVDDLGFVCFEYLPGGSLAMALRESMPVGLALNYLAQMCLALDALHDAGRYHGGLQPGHFLLREEGVVVLADFNVTEQIRESLGDQENPGTPLARTDLPEGIRRDFRALGEIFLQMIQPGDARETALRCLPDQPGSPLLPLELSPLQRCVDGLLGSGDTTAFSTGEEVIIELLGLREVFPFDVRSAEVDGSWR